MWKPEYRLHRNKCRQCGQMFECLKKTQAVCSRACSIASRPEWQRARSIKGGLTRRTAATKREIERLRALGASEVVIVEALRWGRQRYHSGHTTGRQNGVQAGYRTGFAEALGERDQ